LRRPGLHRTIVILLASGFYSGYLPKAPGTFGTLAVIPFYLGIYLSLPLWAYLAVLLPFTALACWAAHQAERIWGERDCSKIVIDEWVGFLVTMAGIAPTWGTVIAGFLVFRLIDIVKPLPIRWLERRISGGVGVVIDDVLAGVYASILMHVGRNWI
jgi:phosphatidylglycerophosphatase A